MERPLIYFLCTGNSCRSQMAEGFARVAAGDRFQVASAGTAPAGLDPRATAVMAEVGVDISGRESKGIAPELLARAWLVVTLCGEADETCPLTSPYVRRVHWALPDPAKAKGSATEIMRAFRSVRDEIRDRVQGLFASL